MTEAEQDEFVKICVEAAVNAFRKKLDPDAEWWRYLPFSGDRSDYTNFDAWVNH